MAQILQKSLIIIVCLVASFINYCLLQVGITFFIPITILPIACAFIFGYQLPALVVLAIGVVDDAMLNLPIGTLASAYLLVAYTIATFVKRSITPVKTVYIFSVLYTIINFLALLFR